MQTPFQPSAVPPPAAPKNKAGKWLALGCGIPVGLIALLIIIGTLAGPKSPNSKGTTNTNAVASSSSSSSKDLLRYAGKWKGTDGTTLWIRGDGKGDFDAGSTTVSGGGVTIDETAKTLAITSFFGIGKTWKVDQAPKSADSPQMTLDGIVYTRNGASGSSDSGDTQTVALNTVPSAAECDKLARLTLTEFDKGVATGDFSRFYQSSSKVWQEQTTPAGLKVSFKDYVTKKVRIDQVMRELKPVYEKPIVEEVSGAPGGILRLKGYYPSNPYRTYFKISYLKENDVWRTSGIHVKIGDPIE